MRLPGFVIVVSLAVVLLRTASAAIDQVELRKGNIKDTPCQVHAEATEEGVHFVFSCQASLRVTNVTYSAVLRLYDGDRLIAVCPIEKSRQGERLQTEFTVARRYLRDSRFYFTQAAVDMPSANQYWFHLNEFAK